MTAIELVISIGLQFEKHQDFEEYDAMLMKGVLDLAYEVRSESIAG